MINDPITTRFTPRDALFLALVRAKVPVEPRWDQLLPVTLVQTEPALFRECLEAIPRERRTAAIKPYLGVSPPRGWTDIFAAVAPIHPEPDLVEAMFAIYKAYAERPDAAARAALEDVAKRVPELAASIAQHLAHKKVAPLVFERVPLPPRDKLTSLQKKQLAWFEQEGGDWAVLELFAVRDAKGKHLYDATIHAGDDGYVFRAGTATKVATFAQGGCEAKGEALMAGLEQGLADSMRGRKKAGPGKPAASAAVTSGAAKPRRSPKPRRATRAR
jgi:hypothetical protein